MNWRLFPALLVCLALCGPAYAQDSCKLDRYAVLPITTLADGRFTVPVELNGTKLDFMVDTGGATAVLASEHAFNLGLSIYRPQIKLRGVGQRVIDTAARIKSFALGPLEGKDIPVYLHPAVPGGADGLLAPEMMKRFDVDIDLARGTLSLFSQKHCPGQVVHWTRQGYVVLPMSLTSRNAHIEVPVTIDGVKFKAMLDTGAGNSIISMRAAKALGITEKSPDLKLVTEEDADHKRYDYPFKMLDFDGIAVSNPRLQIVSDGYLPGRDVDLIVGASVLRRLHLYIAYGEEKLYITPALAN